MPWSRGAFLYEMQQNRVARCWVMRQDDARVIAYLCLWEVADEMHVTNVAVRPDARRQGIARTLLGTVLEDARTRRFKMVCWRSARATTTPSRLRVVWLPRRRPPSRVLLRHR